VNGPWVESPTVGWTNGRVGAETCVLPGATAALPEEPGSKEPVGHRTLHGAFCKAAIPNNVRGCIGDTAHHEQLNPGAPQTWKPEQRTLLTFPRSGCKYALHPLERDLPAVWLATVHQGVAMLVLRQAQSRAREEANLEKQSRGEDPGAHRRGRGAKGVPGGSVTLVGSGGNAWSVHGLPGSVHARGAVGGSAKE